MMEALFERRGVHSLVDGQFGSTGKGALAAWLAHHACDSKAIMAFDGSLSSSGPNSGHTSYFGDKEIVLKLLPTFGVHAYLHGYTIPVYLTAGSIIRPEILKEEAETYPQLPIFVHPNAAIVYQEDIELEHRGTMAQVAGTRSGTGSALIRKIKRDPVAIAKNSYKMKDMPPNVAIQAHRMRPEQGAYFMEVAQGFSLGIHSEFYPKVTSRECTTMQGLADARIPAQELVRTYMCIRTFPIRVGNVDEYSSGGHYDDQVETTWEAVGVEPELTTVTKRVRRVFTFSMTQFYEALLANYPNFVAVNFMNYLKKEDQDELINNLIEVRDNLPFYFDMIAGYGPKISDWRMVNESDHYNIGD